MLGTKDFWALRTRSKQDYSPAQAPRAFIALSSGARIMGFHCFPHCSYGLGLPILIQHQVLLCCPGDLQHQSALVSLEQLLGPRPGSQVTHRNQRPQLWKYIFGLRTGPTLGLLVGWGIFFFENSGYKFTAPSPQPPAAPWLGWAVYRLCQQRLAPVSNINARFPLNASLWGWISPWPALLGGAEL